MSVTVCLCVSCVQIRVTIERQREIERLIKRETERDSFRHRARLRRDGDTDTTSFCIKFDLVFSLGLSQYCKIQLLLFDIYISFLVSCFFLVFVFNFLRRR